MVTVEKDKTTNKYTMEQFLEIMRLLRAPNGCPWDAEQTHESIRNNMLEEAYEAVEAIDNGDFSALREELGDVLMQVVFHSVIAEETNKFNFSDVVNEVCEKLVYRHPHVFGNVQADTSEKVLENWDKLKMSEKHQQSYADTLKSVPKTFPALLRAGKVQGRAQKAGVLITKEEALQTIKNQALTNADIGEILFAAVALARANGLNAEELLYKKTEEFIKDFSDKEKAGTLK